MKKEKESRKKIFWGTVTEKMQVKLEEMRKKTARRVNRSLNICKCQLPTSLFSLEDKERGSKGHLSVPHHGSTQTHQLASFTSSYYAFLLTCRSLLTLPALWWICILTHSPTSTFSLPKLVVKGKATRQQDVSDFSCKSALIYMPVMLLQGRPPISATQNTVNLYYTVNCLRAQPERNSVCQRRGTQYSAESSEQSLSLAHNKFLWISDPKCTAVKAPVGTNKSLNTINSLKWRGLWESQSDPWAQRKALTFTLSAAFLICLKAPRYWRSKGKVVMTRWYAQRSACREDETFLPPVPAELNCAWQKH